MTRTSRIRYLCLAAVLLIAVVVLQAQSASAARKNAFTAEGQEKIKSERPKPEYVRLGDPKPLTLAGKVKAAVNKIPGPKKVMSTIGKVGS